MFKKSLSLTLLISVFATPLFARSDPSNWCGTRGVELTKYFLKIHEKHQKEETLRGISAQAIVRPHADVGEIAVMRSNSTNFIQPNRFDLARKKITFSRNPAGGYNVKVTGGVVAATQGTPITLADDDFRRIAFTGGFSFPFYDATYRVVFLSSDGNLTFRSGDKAITPRDVLRVVAGSPRIAPFFEDLNPALKGTIRVLQTPTRFSVTWNDISQFLDVGTNSNTFQVNLFKNGNIEFIYGSRMDTRSAVVGISQGNSTVSNLRLVNYSGIRNLTGVRTVILERFATAQDIDYTALINEFHQTHSKIFDFVVIFTDFPIVLRGDPFLFAFYSPVQNSVRGIGLDNFNYSKAFGSPKLQGIVNMGFAGKYPNDLNVEFFRLRTYSAIEIMAHEGGHRWLFNPRAVINGAVSLDLLNTDPGHYSFYVDADASLLHGNNFVDNGNGTFTTNAVAEIYNKLDLYLMGFIPAAQVPPFFYVSGNDDKDLISPVGTTVTGQRVDLSVGQIIQAEGARVPTSATSQKSFRVAFILFSKNTNPTAANFQKVDRIRTAYETYFKTKTENKGTLNTTLP